MLDEGLLPQDSLEPFGPSATPLIDPVISILDFGFLDFGLAVIACGKKPVVTLPRLGE